KAVYLRRHADPSHTLASLVAENFFYSVSVAIYVIVAAAAMFFFFDVPSDVRMAGQLSLGAMAVVLTAAAWLAWRQPTLASTLIARLPGTHFPALAARVRQFERQA